MTWLEASYFMASTVTFTPSPLKVTNSNGTFPTFKSQPLIKLFDECFAQLKPKAMATAPDKKAKALDRHIVLSLRVVNKQPAGEYELIMRSNQMHHSGATTLFAQ